MQRRTFLKRGLLGGVLLAAGGGAGLALLPGRVRYLPREALRVLNPRTFNIMAAVAARIVTAEGADPITIAHTVDQALARSIPEAKHDVAQVLELLDNGLVSLLTDGRWKPFTRLDGAAQDAALLAWRDSRLTLRRGAFHVLKNLSTASFYRKEASWRDVGYPGPPDALLALAAAGGVNPPGSVP